VQSIRVYDNTTLINMNLSKSYFWSFEIWENN